MHTVQPVRQLLGRYPFLPPALRRLQEPRRHGEQYGGKAGYGQDPGRPNGRQVRARVALRLRGHRTGLEQLRRHHRGVIALFTPLPQMKKNAQTFHFHVTSESLVLFCFVLSLSPVLESLKTHGPVGGCSSIWSVRQPNVQGFS